MWVAGGYEIKAQSQINIKLNLLAKETGRLSNIIPGDRI
jgi:hypothetical protein